MQHLDIKFYDIEHKKSFESILEKMHSKDCYHMSFAYLITLDTVCRKHINDLFDFTEDCIQLTALEQLWQTSTSRKTTRLAFNLWNGMCSDGKEYYDDEDGYNKTLPSRYFAVDEIFACSYAPYYYQAISLRYPEYSRS